MSIFNSPRETSLLAAKEKPWYVQAWRGARKALFETTAEVWIGLALVGALAGGLSYRHEASKAGEIPLAFSEIEQITADFNAASKPVPALTRFYAVNNDIAMKVFESNNIALAVNESHKIFALEMQSRIDARLKKHALISEYAEEMPQDVRNALQSVEKLSAAAQGMPGISRAFDDAWSYSKRDVTHTRHWTTQSCDSNGKCTTQHHSEEVYDYSWHTYTFHPDQARLAAQLLRNFMAQHPDVQVDEKLVVSSATHEQNEAAIRESRKRELEGKPAMTPEEYRKLANNWASGSNLLKYAPEAQGNYAALRAMAAEWDAALTTARSQTYKTYSRFDSGPSEYQTAGKGETYSARTSAAAHGVLDGIYFSSQKVPELNNMIRDYVDVVLNGKAGNPDKLRSSIMSTARELYDQNYENGFNVHTFSWLAFILITMGGMAAGAGAGYGVDRLLNGRRREWYEDVLAEEAKEDRERLRELERQATSREFNGEAKVPTGYNPDDFKPRSERSGEPATVETPKVETSETPVLPLPQQPANDDKSTVPQPDQGSEARRKWLEKYRKVGI